MMNRKSFSTRMKDAYNESDWKIGAQKEEAVAKSLRDLGFDVIESGFGAGSTERIEGSSGEHGFEKAQADLTVSGTPVVIEVTGPLKPIPATKAIWLNYSKYMYALSHPELEYWLAHVNGPGGIIRYIKVGRVFAMKVRDKKFGDIRPRFRGVTNRFIEIPAKHMNTAGGFLEYMVREHGNGISNNGDGDLG